MKKEFVVDDLSYVAEYSNNSIEFYIDTERSARRDFFVGKYSRNFYDDVPSRVYSTTSVKSPFNVLKSMILFVEDVIRANEPYYFRYVANEPKKVSVYYRFAKQIGKKYGYDVTVDENAMFHFYRISD